MVSLFSLCRLEEVKPSCRALLGWFTRTAQVQAWAQALSARWHFDHIASWKSKMADAEGFRWQILLCMRMRYLSLHGLRNDASINASTRKRKHFLFLCLRLYLHLSSLHVRILCLCLCRTCKPAFTFTDTSYCCLETSSREIPPVWKWSTHGAKCIVCWRVWCPLIS